MKNIEPLHPDSSLEDIIQVGHQRSLYAKEIYLLLGKILKALKSGRKDIYGVPENSVEFASEEWSQIHEGLLVFSSQLMKLEIIKEPERVLIFGGQKETSNGYLVLKEEIKNFRERARLILVTLGAKAIDQNDEFESLLVKQGWIEPIIQQEDNTGSKDQVEPNQSIMEKNKTSQEDDIITRFPTPQGSKWEHLTITFPSHGHRFKAKFKGMKRAISVEFTEIGLMDKKTKNPNKQWELLRFFTESENGELTREELNTIVIRLKDRGLKNEASPDWDKRISRLSKALKEFFQISDPPIMKEKWEGWKCRFNTCSNINAAKTLSSEDQDSFSEDEGLNSYIQEKAPIIYEE